MLKKFAIFMARLSIVGLFLVVGFERVFYPTLHSDEGLFVGAAVAVLNGDVLLNQYWFDKPFLVPWLILSGILVGGRNAFGFHLAGWMFSIIGCMALLSWLVELARGQVSRASRPGFNVEWPVVLSLIVGLAALTLPFMTFYHASAFTDPFLLCFLILFARSLWRAANSDDQSLTDTYERSAFCYFALATLCKLASVMWLPVLVGYFLRNGSVAAVVQGLKRVFHTTRYYWLVALIYMLTNPQKLAPVLWLDALVNGWTKKKSGDRANVLTRAKMWLNASEDVFVWPFMFWFVLALLIVATLLFSTPLFHAWRKTQGPLATRMRDLATGPQRNHWLGVLLILLPFWLHAVGILLSGASVFDRYLYILIPQAICVLALGLREAWLVPRRPLVAKVGVVAASFFLVGTMLSQYRFISLLEGNTRKILEHPSVGRLSMQVMDELPATSVVHQYQRLWSFYPYIVGRATALSCLTDECYAEAHLGRSPFISQFRVAEPANLYGTDPVRLEQATIKSCSASEPCSIDSADVVIDLTGVTGEYLRRKLKLGGWVKDVSMRPDISNHSPGQLTTSTSDMRNDSGLSLSWSEIAGAGLVIDLHTGISVNGSPLVVTIAGKLAVSNGAAVEFEEGQRRIALGFRAERINISGFDFNAVDIMPLIRRGYFVPFFPISLGVGGLKEVSVESLSWVSSAANGGALPNLVAHVNSYN